jgi:hypothetical protein
MTPAELGSRVPIALVRGVIVGPRAGRNQPAIGQLARRLGGEPGVISVTWEVSEERTDC